MNRNLRCGICNSVSHPEIRDETSPLFHGPFVEDGPGYICGRCADCLDDDDEALWEDGYVYFYEDDDEA
jgi:hypothetical protein